MTADKKPRKVTIAVMDLSVQLHYTAIPSLAEKAYLRAKTKNSSEYQLLSGTMNVFNDNVFVANSQLGVSFHWNNGVVIASGVPRGCDFNLFCA